MPALIQLWSSWCNPYDTHYFISFCSVPWLPRWFSGKESTCQCRRCGFDPWVGKIAWRRKWQLTPVFLPAKSHGQRSLVVYSPKGRKESDTTEHTHKTQADSIPGSGESPGEGHGNPLQYSCLKNPMDRGFLQATVHRVTKS